MKTGNEMKTENEMKTGKMILTIIVSVGFLLLASVAQELVKPNCWPRPD